MRLMIEAILWILLSGAPWRDLPEACGSWQGAYGWFRAWTKGCLWSSILCILTDREHDDEQVMIDSTSM